MEISIASVDQRHLEQLTTLLRESIEDTCRRNRIADRSIIDNEVDEKVSKLEKYVSSDINCQSMICATNSGQPVAVGGYFTCGNDIISCTAEATETDFEIGSIYVSRHFQGIGIGRLVFGDLKDRVRAGGALHAFLDSGYPSSQAYWRKVLGAPSWDTASAFGRDFLYQIWKIDLR